MKTDKLENVDAHISSFPFATQKILREVREIIIKAAPDAAESISYGMPAYKLNGKPLIYFAGYDKHIGLYATPTGHEAFKKNSAGTKQVEGQYSSRFLNLCH
jgi:uncharacterized protein YdhG (YjbR/CyaY superfamily)